ncbi:MAG: glycosyltransferase [Planctomycetota bacterium]
MNPLPHASLEQAHKPADDLRTILQERDRLRGERETLRHAVDHRDDTIKDHVELDYVLQSFLRSVEGSRFWRWLQPLRGAVRWLRPIRFDAAALIPWRQIERTADAAEFAVTGTSAHFLAPCLLPKGWLKVTLRMSSDTAGFVELRADTGKRIRGARTLERMEIHGQLDREFYVYLDRSVKALQLMPLDAPGNIRIDKFHVATVAPPVALAEGLRRRAGGLGRGLMRSAGLLMRGRIAELARQPKDGLSNKKLNIVYVLKFVGLCGGVKVVLEHASRLQARGHNVCIYHLGGEHTWFSRQVPEQFFETPDDLREALAAFRGIKVATWYETAPWVAESLAEGDRGYYLVQDIEDSYATNAAEAQSALATYQLPLTIITEGHWVRDQLSTRFARESVFVSIGLDHQRFFPAPALVDTQRILTQARTWSGGGWAGEWLKGWATARDAVALCRQHNPKTALTTFSLEKKPEMPVELSHIHFQEPSDPLLTELYRQAGIYLMTSNHEGFGLTAAEAMACGCPVVTTAAQGNEEFCIDGVTALVAPAGDAEAVAEKLLRLQRDPHLARRLVENARNLITTYTWDRVIDRLEGEFLGMPVPEIVIPAIEPQAYDNDAVPRALPALQAAVRPAFAKSTLPKSEVNRSWAGEYPQMPLRPATCECTIVIPTINTSRLVEQCIRSCRAQLPKKARVEFIVVDDGSPERAVRQELRRLSKELDFRLIFNGQNLGFSASVNRGLRASRGKYVVLCNNDIQFFQPWLEPLRCAFAEDARIGIVGGRLLFPDGTIQHAGMDKIPGQLVWPHTNGGQKGDLPAALKSQYVWSVTGAFYAIRRSTLRRLGGLSTGFCTAYEDLDYSLNAWTHGVRVLYSGDIAATHVEGGTRGAQPKEKATKPLVWSQRQDAGQAYFERKWDFLRGIESFETLELLGERQRGDTLTNVSGTRAEALPASI